MLTTTLDLTEDGEPQLQEEATRPDVAPAPDGPAAHLRRSPLVVALLGLALATLAVATLVRVGTATETSGQSANAAPATQAEVGTADLIYEPGHSSGWHVHAGVHSVVVLSGMLTVYDDLCRRTDYGPGQTYLGGRSPHIARNAGIEAVQIVVTYVYDSPGAHHPGTAVPGPAGCGIAAK